MVVSHQKLGAPTKPHFELKNKSVECKQSSSTPNNSELLLAIRWKQQKMDMTQSQSLSSPGSNTAAPQLITRYINTLLVTKRGTALGATGILSPTAALF